MAKHQFTQDVKNIPNMISLMRIVVIAICVIAFLCDYPVIGSSLGLFAGLSDYADGIIARKYHMETRLGALLDQVSDLLFNFLVISAGVYMGVWPIWILFAWGLRDLGVLSMRASAAQLGFDIPSIYLGKLASAVIYYSLFIMPLAYAATSGQPTDALPFPYLYTPENQHIYHNAPWVTEHLSVWIGFGLYWICLAGVITGIVLQWITAIKYGKTYIRKYDELHHDDGAAKAAKEDVANEDAAGTSGDASANDVSAGGADTSVAASEEPAKEG